LRNIYETPNKIYTINNGQKRELTQNENNIFNQAKQLLNDNLNEKIKILYRGEEKNNLSDKLNTSNQNTIFTKLFRVGDKSANHYNNNENTRNYLQDINDISDNTFKYIFNTIKDNLNDDDSNSETLFEKYFIDTDINTFLNQINDLNNIEKLRIRDYYYAYLHTCNELVNNITHYISTSLNPNHSWNYWGDNIDDKILFHFILRKPYLDFAIYSKNQGHLKSLCTKNNLPNYQARYSNEDEISVKGLLLANYIFGIEYIENGERYFLVNPYLFKDNYNINNLLTDGLPISLKDVIETIITTNYNKVCTIFENGNFQQTNIK